ncbi:hypothetical protein GQ600_26849 [Phytophthora cactorum]|nr:hypothetical protein GQ600_26849 [Phytophthora cactorum]
MGDLDFDKVKTLMSNKLELDVTLTDADSCVSKLAHDMRPRHGVDDRERPEEDRSLPDGCSVPKEVSTYVENEMARESNKPLL